MKFGQVCETSRITHANACGDQRKAIQKGDAPDPVVKLLDRVLEKMRKAAKIAVAAFQKLFQEALLPHVTVQHLLMLLNGAYDAVTQFRMIVWRMVADEWHHAHAAHIPVFLQLGDCDAACLREIRGPHHLLGLAGIHLQCLWSSWSCSRSMRN